MLARTSSFCCAMAGLLAGCAAATPGAAPHDMSAAGHERAAAEAEAEAAAHAAEFDPAAAAGKTRCTGARTDPDLQPCWTMDVNPTTEHLAHAAHMRRAAADHRAASQALRDAESAACAGLAEDDRDMSPLQRAGDVIGVEELRDMNGAPKAAAPARLAGAAVTLRAVPGLTKEYLQRVVSCHLARNAVTGHAMPEMAACPLSVKGATATVERAANGAFRVEVRAEDAAAAADILRRARLLVPGSAP